MEEAYCWIEKSERNIMVVLVSEGDFNKRRTVMRDMHLG